MLQRYRLIQRKAASLKDNSAAPWSTVTSDIETQLKDAGDFIRQTGKSNISEFNVIMRSSEWISLKKSNYFTANANFNQVSLVDINMPQAQAIGGSYQGRISAGAYIFNIWTYDETYEDASNTTQYYMPAKKVVVLPVSGYTFVKGYAAVPAIVKEDAVMMRGDYIVDEYVDKKHRAKTWTMQSAPLCIPVSIDQIYTMQVEA